MQPFQRLESVAMPIDRANVDTDQILPARYLQKPRANNFGDFLFRDLRSLPDGSPDPRFVLNRPEYRDARIVVAARNFACGSSREHAVWALYDHGFRAVICSGFSDIFHANAIKNGLLPVVLSQPQVDALLAMLLRDPAGRVAVDLQACQVRMPDASVVGFEIDPFARKCLLEGIDELDYTLGLRERIEAFEAHNFHPQESM
jgi:3-isopropylmalate/(R)-2-methylmalate dehydratase small subunit